MAGNSSFSVLLKVLGDSSSAVGAVTKLANGLDSLGNTLQTVSQKANGLGANIRQSTSRAQGAFSKIIAAAKQAGAAVKTAFSSLSGKVNAPTLNLSAFNRLTPIIQRIKDGLARAAGGVSAFVGSLGRVGAPIDKLSAFVSKAIENTTKLTTTVAGFAPVAISVFGKAAAAVGSFAASLARNAAGKVGGGLSAMFGDNGVMKRFASGLMTVREQLMNVNDAVRLAAQGMTNFGRSMLFFVTLPVAAFMSGMIRGAIDFEDAMVRVQKTSGMTNDELGVLTERIRQIAITSASSHTELAGIAEVVGQLGVQSPEAIANLTRVFDVFAKSTSQVGEEVATTMGRIAAAFGRDLSTSQEWVWRLANSINTLENETAATASEIQTALADFAPFANVLKLTAAEAAGLTATLISLGLSPDETGTALRNLSEYIVANAEDVSKLMGTYKEAYGTIDGLLNALETDALAVFTDMATAMQDSSQPLQAMTSILGVLEKRGGRAIVLLAQNIDMLKANLDSANLSWDQATSLIEEYEKAMSSTKSQLGVLRNNIQEAGLILGEALLPVINEFVSVAVPAIQQVAAWFKSLSRTQQLNIVMWGALALAAGPVLMFFGQMIHAVSLLFMGFGQLIRVISFVISTLGGLGPVVLRVAGIFTSVPGLIISGFVVILKVLSKLGVDIAGFFRKIGNAARSWGENLAANIANGLLAGAVRYVVRAIQYIANLIASFFESHSPPKKGPLSTIDKWGVGLMKTFLEGFKAADFSVLEDISSTIENILTSGAEDGALVAGLRKLATARTKLAALISRFNQTGVIDEGLLSQATAGLGDMTEKVKELIRLQLRYNALQELLAEIEQRREQISQAYDDEIAAIGASNMSIAEKIDAIRAAKRAREDANAGLDEEEESLQNQADLIKEQLDAQKGMIDALQKQKDIFQRIADTLKQMAEAAANSGRDESMGGAGGGGGFGDLSGAGAGLTEGLDESLGAAQEKMQGFFDRLNSIITFEEGKKKLQGFIDGLNDVPPAMESAFDDAKAYETYQAMYKLGQTVDSIRDKLLAYKDTTMQVWDNLKKVFSGNPQGGNLFSSIKSSPEFQKISTAINNIWAGIQRLGANLKAVFLPVWNTLKAQFIAMKPTFEQLGQAFGNLWQALQPALPVFAGIAKVIGGVLLVALGVLISLLTGAVTGIAQFVTGVISGFTQITTGIYNGLAGLISFISGFIQVLYGLITGSTETVSQGLANMGNGITRSVQGFMQLLNGFVNFLVTGVLGGIASFASTALATFVGLYNTITGNTTTWAAEFAARIQDGIAKAGSFFSQAVPQWIQAATDLVQGFIDGITQKWGEVYTTVKGKLDEFIATVKSALGVSSPSVIFMQIGADLIQGLINGINSLMGALSSAIQSVATKILDTIKTIFGGKEQKGGGFDINSILPDEKDVKTRTSALEKLIDNFSKGIVKSIDNAGKELTKSWENTWKNLDKAIGPVEKAVAQFTSNVTKDFSKTTSDIQSKWNRTWSDMGRNVSTAGTSVKNALNAIGSSASSALSAIGNRISSITSSFSSLRSSITQTSSSVSSFVSALGRIGSNPAQGLVSSFLAAKSAISQAYTTLNTFISRLSALQNTTIRATVVASGSGASWSGSGSQTTTTWTGTGSVTPRASGGYVVPGQSYVVGEIGPELFIPSQGGTVVPNYLLRQAFLGAGAGQEAGGITININGPVVRDETDIRRLADMVARELTAAVNSRTRFGGNIRT